MLQGDRPYLWLLVGAVALAVAAELLAPEPVDWTDSFERDDARPYGSLVLYDVLDELFPDADVQPVPLPPYLKLRDTTLATTSYLFVTHAFTPDPPETGKLLSYVERGNVLFVAAHVFRGAWADSLHLKTVGGPSLVPAQSGGNSTHLHFVSPALHTPGGYLVRGGAATQHFARFDTLHTAVLGINDDDEPTYLRIDRGRGAIYVSSTPRVFTNYHLLNDASSQYLYAALSYLPSDPQTVFWDAHHKPLASGADTPLRFVLADPALKTAYFLLIGGVLLFIIVQGKRRQRAIPVVEPPRNTTLEFVETVGRLYYERGDHADLARKKIKYFFDYLRTHLNVSPDIVDDKGLRRVAERSGVPLPDVRAVFDAIADVRQRRRLSEEALKTLNHRIETFYAKSKR